jgi:hypothetical protein
MFSLASSPATVLNPSPLEHPALPPLPPMSLPPPPATTPFLPVPEGGMKKEYLVREMTMVRTEIQHLKHELSCIKQENQALHKQNQFLNVALRNFKADTQHEIQQFKNHITGKVAEPTRQMHNDETLVVSDSEDEEPEVRKARERQEKSCATCKSPIVKVSVSATSS